MHVQKILVPALLAVTMGCGLEYEPAAAEGVDEARAELRAAKRPAAPTYALKTTDTYTAGVAPVWKSSFSLNTNTIYFSTVVTGTLSGHHTQSVFVTMPGGAPYQGFDVAFATDVVAGPGEQQAEKTSTGWRVWVAMPVAGTMISQGNLVGTWSVETWVDSATAANARASFSLY